MRNRLKTSIATSRLMLVGIAGAFIAITGCPPPTQQTPSPKPPAKPKPLRQFENIIEDLTRVIGGGDPRNNRDPSMQGGGNAQWNETLTHKLIEPEDETDIYRATVTITRRYKITVFTRPEKSEDKEDDSSPSRSDDPIAAPDAIGGIDPLVMEDPGGGGERGGASISPIKTIDNEKERTFYLEYKNDRWELVTQTDEETELSIQAAFEYALKRQ